MTISSREALSTAMMAVMVWRRRKPLEASSSMLDSTSIGDEYSSVAMWRWRKENQKENRDEGVISCSLRKWVSKGKMVIPSLSVKVMELRKWVFDDPFSLFQ